MVMPVRYKVSLSECDRARLERLTRTGSHPVRMVMRARVLLELDENHGPVDHRGVIAGRVGTSENTVARIAKAFAEAQDVDAVIRRKKRLAPPVAPKATGEVEARLIALACSKPPEGRHRWTLRLLEKYVVATDGVDEQYAGLVEGIPALDHSTIGRVLKRGRSSLT